jgi:hypothetical protein
MTKRTERSMWASAYVPKPLNTSHYFRTSAPEPFIARSANLGLGRLERHGSPSTLLSARESRGRNRPIRRFLKI